MIKQIAAIGFALALNTGHATILTRDGPSAFNSYLFGLNNLGQLVGAYNSATTAGAAIVWNPDGTYSTFNEPGGNPTYAFDINDKGDIVGTVFGNPSLSGFLRESSGNFVSINVPGATFTRADGINNHGQIVGSYQIGAYVGSFLREADGTFILFQAVSGDGTQASKISDTGIIVGSHTNGAAFFGSVSAGFTLFNAPGFTLGYGINTAGVIVGRSDSLPNPGQYFIRQSDGSYSLDKFPGTMTTFLYDINDSNQMVGTYQDSSGSVHSFLLDSSLPNPGVVSTPGVLPLLLHGLFALSVASRRRRKYQPQTQIRSRGQLSSFHKPRRIFTASK